MMISVKISSNYTRETKMVDSSATIRSTLEESGVDYSRGMTMLDGATLRPGDMDKTFDDFGIQDVCYLSNVVKADNA